ncbi:MAG: hypothetical protein OIF48_07610 [Silicimonas sp.]|nr:hypothetical protein [Silicimonas sp.]
MDILDRLKDRSRARQEVGEQVNHVIRRLNLDRHAAAAEITRLRNLVLDLGGDPEPRGQVHKLEQ